MLIDDFTRPEYFEKNSKLDLILEYQPVDLDATHLEEIEHKLIQLAILTPWSLYSPTLTTHATSTTLATHATLTHFFCGSQNEGILL